jgi:hypothetical protein
VGTYWPQQPGVGHRLTGHNDFTNPAASPLSGEALQSWIVDEIKNIAG